MIPIVALLVYHGIAFGHPLSSPYHNRVGAWKTTEGLAIGSSIPSIKIAGKLLFGLRRGLFLSIPISIFAFFSMRKLKGHSGRPADLGLRTAWLLFIVFFVWNTSRHFDWEGGSGFFGPRYLMPALPFLFIMLIHALRYIPRVLLALFGSASLLFNLAGAHYRQPYDIDAVAMFLVRGPRFPFIAWLATIPEASRLKFPDLFPPSNIGFLVALLILLVGYTGLTHWLSRK